MNKIFTLPTGEITDFVDILLEKTGQDNNAAVDFDSINDYLKLKKEEIDFSDEINLPEIGEQLEIRGILDIDSKKILINNNESDMRMRFSNAHELGHFILPKHREVLYQCNKSDMSHLTHLIIEREANQFAAKLLFKGSLFKNFISDFSDITFATIKEVANQFSSSITAALRRTVEENSSPIAMVVIKEIESRPKILYTITSNSFRKKYFKDVKNLSKLKELYLECYSSSLENPIEKTYNAHLKSGETVDIKGLFFYNMYEVLGILTPSK